MVEFGNPYSIEFPYSMWHMTRACINNLQDLNMRLSLIDMIFIRLQIATLLFYIILVLKGNLLSRYTPRSFIVLNFLMIQFSTSILSCNNFSNWGLQPKTRNSIFSGFICSQFPDNHFSTSHRVFSRECMTDIHSKMSTRLHALWMVWSSTKLLRPLSSGIMLKSVLAYILKTCGPTAEPWGTE